MKKPNQRSSGYRIGFLQFHPYEKSRWMLKYSSTYIANEWKSITISHVARQWTNTEANQQFFNIKPPTMFHIFSISYRTYTTKINIFYQIHIGLSQQHYPESTIFKDTRRISHGQPIFPYKENEWKSWKWWYQGNDLTSEQK